MKVLILNGSPRKNGNTRTLLTALAEEAGKNHQVELVDLQSQKIAPCLGCDACRKNGGTCVQKDDAPALLQKVLEADCIIFGSPVYWWGISAQLKLAIDRLYAGGAAIKGKKIGVVAVGADGLDTPQYRLIREQFACIGEYLDWEVLFSEGVSAYVPGEVAKDAALMERFRALGRNL